MSRTIMIMIWHKCYNTSVFFLCYCCCCAYKRRGVDETFWRCVVCTFGDMLYLICVRTVTESDPTPHCLRPNIFGWINLRTQWMRWGRMPSHDLIARSIQNARIQAPSTAHSTNHYSFRFALQKYRKKMDYAFIVLCAGAGCDAMTIKPYLERFIRFNSHPIFFLLLRKWCYTFR